MARGRPLEVNQELLEAFDSCARVTEYLVKALPRRVWHTDPPGGGRTMAAIVAHMQSVRRTFAKMGGAPQPGSSLDRTASGQAEAVRELRRSRDSLNALFRDALARSRARVKGMPRRTVDMIVYLIQHEAHHRGQICALARALGYRLSGPDVTRIWGWARLPGSDRAARSKDRRPSR